MRSMISISLRPKFHSEMPRLHQAWIDYDRYSRIKSGQETSYLFKATSYVYTGDRIKLFCSPPHVSEVLKLVLCVTKVSVVAGSQPYTCLLKAEFRVLS
jgi:hypothetical protein